MLKSDFYPYIQTHRFSCQPYLNVTQGYAPFIYSPHFRGSERVQFYATAGGSLPDTNSTSRVLSEFNNRQWFLSDQERQVSATAGCLPSGLYQFAITNLAIPGTEEPIQISCDFKNHFLEPIAKIQLHENTSSVEISWASPRGAENFWIFIFPDGATDFLAQLTPISEKKHEGTSLSLSKAQLTTGIYRIAIRANQMWHSPEEASGFLAESWAISKNAFCV